jgi:O-antigen ligase
MVSRSATRSPPCFVLASLTLLAPALGGATQLWAEATLLLALAFVFIWFPPRDSLGRWWNSIFLLLAAAAVAEFLPDGWAGTPEWRRMLLEQFGARLPGTLSAQPWLGCEACCFYLAGLAWAYYLLACTWTTPARRKSVRLYALGAGALAALSLAAYWWQFKVPFWPAVGNSPIDFGFFPNRNQTANVLALGAVMMTALVFEDSERNGKWGLLWIPLMLLTALALIVDYSRAGVILFFGGTAAWLGCAIPASRSKATGTLCLAGVVLMLAVFLLYGGETLRRFQPDPGDESRFTTDFRLSVQEDAIAFADQSPLLGQGLGNFEYLFPLYRQKSAADNRALHPESDWLWAAGEMGWPATILLLIGFACWLAQCFPFARGTDPRLRSAAAVCGVGFALHGLVDVSGHRPGALWPALFLCSIALNPNRRVAYKSWVAPLFRCIGVLLIPVAAWWLVSNEGNALDKNAPTSCTLVRLRDQADAAMAAKDYAGVIDATTAALRIAPLDWRLYFQRAVAGAVSHAATGRALQDFGAARYLAPQEVKPCFLEGELLLALGQPAPALAAWKEALRRSGGDSLPLYQRMLADGPLNASILPDLEILAGDNREYWLVALQFVSPMVCDLLIGDLLARDPDLLTLSHEQRKSLFATWYQRGNRSFLISNLLATPAWMLDGWYWLAEDYAEKRDFREAYLLTMKFTTRPAMPAAVPSAPISDLERMFFYHSDDVHYGMDLYLEQRKLGRTKEALGTLLQLAKSPGRPAYISYLEAELYAEQGDWENAWAARLDYSPLPGG